VSVRLSICRSWSLTCEQEVSPDSMHRFCEAQTIYKDRWHCCDTVIHRASGLKVHKAGRGDHEHIQQTDRQTRSLCSSRFSHLKCQVSRCLPVRQCSNQATPSDLLKCRMRTGKRRYLPQCAASCAR